MREKTSLGAANALYPSLCTLVGAVVDGRPNFLTVAHVGIMNHGTPQYICVGLNKSHHTNKGIRAHGQFSVNLPPRSLVAETDYAGLVSGANTDKSGLFETHFGTLEHAPLIADCPVAMECRLHSTIDFESHDVFVGEIVQTWADPDVLTDGRIDLAKADPLLFDFSSAQYWSLGEPVARCWNAGKALKHGR